MMGDDLIRVAVHLDAGPDADAQEVDALTTRLRRHLLQLDVQSVDRARTGRVPPGARAVDVVALGGLVVTLAKSAEMLKAVVGMVQSMIAARPGRSVKLVIGGDSVELSGVSSEEQRRLVDLFVARHAG
jgi:hypothetical protein